MYTKEEIKATQDARKYIQDEFLLKLEVAVNYEIDKEIKQLIASDEHTLQIQNTSFVNKIREDHENEIFEMIRNELEDEGLEEKVYTNVIDLLDSIKTNEINMEIKHDEDQIIEHYKDNTDLNITLFPYETFIKW